MKPPSLVLLLALAGALLGCPKTHCQSGAKHGTKCYDHDSGYQTSSDEGQPPPADPQKQRPATTPRWK